MKTAAALGLCMALVACGQLPVRVLDENERGVVIQGTADRARAEQAAEKSCARFHRHARFNQMDSFRDYVFDCVN
ncbi:MAG: hypothetical protein KGJ15_03115 [Betaproteobacteria bacterium]|nr:hypothetical protein [Betaproteobacteria bacterium]MDE2131734.1 hypothetical protein [Betaproteobacteria bacterium]